MTRHLPFLTAGLLLLTACSPAPQTTQTAQTAQVAEPEVHSVRVRAVTLPATVRSGESLTVTWEVGVGGCDHPHELRVTREAGGPLLIRAMAPSTSSGVCTTEGIRWQRAGLVVPPSMLGTGGRPLDVRLNGQEIGQVTVQ